MTQYGTTRPLWVNAECQQHQSSISDILYQFQGVTTRAHHYNCDDQHSGIESCEKETGYYLDPREPCETYSHFGRLPALNPEGWSILCAEPGRLSDLFSVSAELDDLSTMFVDKTVK